MLFLFQWGATHSFPRSTPSLARNKGERAVNRHQDMPYSTASLPTTNPKAFPAELGFPALRWLFSVLQHQKCFLNEEIDVSTENSHVGVCMPSRMCAVYITLACRKHSAKQKQPARNEILHEVGTLWVFQIEQTVLLLIRIYVSRN